MSLKRILSKQIPESEKRDRKILNTNSITHDRISILADIFNVNKTQVVHNIVQEFIQNNEAEIKDQIEIKQNQLGSIF